MKLTKFARQRGGWTTHTGHPGWLGGTTFGPDDLGARCLTCGLPMVQTLIVAEPHNTHPCCPDPPPKRKPRKRSRR